MASRVWQWSCLFLLAALADGTYTDPRRSSVVEKDGLRFWLQNDGFHVSGAGCWLVIERTMDHGEVPITFSITRGSRIRVTLQDEWTGPRFYNREGWPARDDIGLKEALPALSDMVDLRQGQRVYARIDTDRIAKDFGTLKGAKMRVTYESGGLEWMVTPFLTGPFHEWTNRVKVGPLEL